MEALATLEQQARQAVESAPDLQALDQVRVHFLGKKGLLTAQLKELGKLPSEQRPQAGQAINEAKKKVAEQEGFDLVVDAGPGIVVYSKPELDLTDKVLQSLEEARGGTSE
mgnify:CR=1 FL=1